MSKNTADCKKFIAEFFYQTPSLVQCFAAINQPDVDIRAVADASQYKNWERTYKGSPFKKEYRYWERSKAYGEDDLITNNSPFTIPGNMLKAVREFQLSIEKYGDAMVFLILEDIDGNLYLGDYVGATDRNKNYSA